MKYKLKIPNLKTHSSDTKGQPHSTYAQRGDDLEKSVRLRTRGEDGFLAYVRTQYTCRDTPNRTKNTIDFVHSLAYLTS